MPEAPPRPDGRAGPEPEIDYFGGEVYTEGLKYSPRT